jgi:hypothetical protein
MDLDLLTDFGGEIATAIGVAGGLFITAVVATQTFRSTRRPRPRWFLRSCRSV